MLATFLFILLKYNIMKAYLITTEKEATELAQTEKCMAKGKQNKFTVYKWFSGLPEMIEFNKKHSVDFKECNEL